MAKAKLRYGNTGTRDYTPGADKAAGEIVILSDNRLGVCIDAIANGKLGSVMIDGVFDIDSESATTVSAGGVVYADISDGNDIIPSGSKTTGDVLAGLALVAKVSGDLVCTVDLNAAAGTVSP